MPGDSIRLSTTSNGNPARLSSAVSSSGIRLLKARRTGMFPGKAYPARRNRNRPGIPHTAFARSSGVISSIAREEFCQRKRGIPGNFPWRLLPACKPGSLRISNFQAPGARILRRGTGSWKNSCRSGSQFSHGWCSFRCFGMDGARVKVTIPMQRHRGPGPVD